MPTDNQRKPAHIAVLHPAYVWDCEECGRENFQRAIVISEEEKMSSIREMQDDDEPGPPPEMLEIMTCCTYPVRVTCKHCNQEFTTADPNFGNDLDDYGNELDDE